MVAMLIPDSRNYSTMEYISKFEKEFHDNFASLMVL